LEAVEIECSDDDDSEE
jgi:hypothetical protein